MVLSKEAWSYFIGGLMRMSRECAITNCWLQFTNVWFRDLLPGLHCLVIKLRPLIRISPAERGVGTRIGTALSGSAGNPYPGAGSLPGSRTGCIQRADLRLLQLLTEIFSI